MNLGDSNDRVKRSSGGTLGAVKFENDLAADLSAWSEAVRFDLNDLNLAVDWGSDETTWEMSRLTISS